jgi:hypothetical protein
METTILITTLLLAAATWLIYKLAETLEPRK